MKTGELSSVQRPSRRSSGVRCSGLNAAADATRSQYASRAARAPDAPPLVQPSASTAAFMAPAEVPEMASIWSHGSSSRRSRTPQVKAPCEPPPCRARSISNGLHCEERRSLAFLAARILRRRSDWASSPATPMCRTVELVVVEGSPYGAADSGHIGRNPEPNQGRPC